MITVNAPFVLAENSFVRYTGDRIFVQCTLDVFFETVTISIRVFSTEALALRSVGEVQIVETVANVDAVEAAGLGGAARFQNACERIAVEYLGNIPENQNVVFEIQ